MAGKALLSQPGGRLDHGVEDESRADHRKMLAPAEVLAAAHREALVSRIEEGSLGAMRPHEAHAVNIRHQLGAAVGADRVGGVEDVAGNPAAPGVHPGHTAEESHVRQGHLGRAVRAERS